MESLDNFEVCSVMTDETSPLMIEKDSKPKRDDYQHYFYEYIGKILDEGREPTYQEIKDGQKYASSFYMKDLKRYHFLKYYYRNKNKLNKKKVELVRRKREAARAAAEAVH